MRTMPVSTSASVSAALGGLLTLAVAVGIGRFVYTPILPLMVDALGLSKFTAGLIASANLAGYLAGALFAAGALPGSRRTWLLGALLASALTTGAMGFTHSVPMFLVLRFAGGVASALALILASAIVLEVLAEANRPGFSSMLFGGVGVGIVVSATLISALRADGADWQALWVASGALSLVATLAVAMLIPNRSHSDRSRPRDRAAQGNPALLRLVAAYGLFGFGYVITATFLVAMVRGNQAVRPLEPMIWMVFGLAAAPSVALWTRLAGPLGLPGAFGLACLTEAAGVLISVAWPSIAGLFLGAVLVGGTFMGLTALGLVRGRSLGTGDGHRVIALMTGAFGLGQIIGPSLAGALYDRFGSFTVPSAIAAAALVLAALLARS
jgi:predicted MFS family arabinose efflux permease